MWRVWTLQKSPLPFSLTLRYYPVQPATDNVQLLLEDILFSLNLEASDCCLLPQTVKVCSNPGFYRTICISPTFGKVLDKICATRLANFLIEINYLMSARQYEFWKNFSVVDALHKLLEFIAESKRRTVYASLFMLSMKSLFRAVSQESCFRKISPNRTF